MVLPLGVTHVRHLNVSMAYSGMEIGNMDYRFGAAEDVQASREKLLRALSPIKNIVMMPLGGSEFIDLSGTPEPELADEYRTDGLFIDRPGTAIGLNTADCIAMAIYGRGSPALGVIHAGRKGVDAGIHTSAAEHMMSRYDMAADDIRFFFGPSIRQNSYYYPEISEEQLADPKWDGLIEHRDGNYHIDLVGRAMRDLAAVGIDPAQIQVPDVDTGAEDSGYFSHTRGSRNGEPKARNGFAAMVMPE